MKPMISLLSKLGRKSLALLVVLIVCALPAAASAETIYIENATGGQYVVHVSAVSKGMVTRDPPSPLKPGESATTMLPGNKLITITDAGAPAKPPYSLAVPSGTVDLYFQIEANAKGQVKLKQVPPPKKP